MIILHGAKYNNHLRTKSDSHNGTKYLDTIEILFHVIEDSEYLTKIDLKVSKGTSALQKKDVTSW